MLEPGTAPKCDQMINCSIAADFYCISTPQDSGASVKQDLCIAIKKERYSIDNGVDNWPFDFVHSSINQEVGQTNVWNDKVSGLC